MFCKNCGSEIKDNSAFCNNCGEKLDYEFLVDNTQREPNPQKPNKNSGNIKALWILIIALLLVLCILIVIILCKKANNDDSTSPGYSSNSSTTNSPSNSEPVDNPTSTPSINDNSNTNNGSTNDSTSENKPVNTVRLKEIESTGEILYKNFVRCDEFDCGSREAFHFYNEGGEKYLGKDLFVFRYDGKEGYADAYGNIVIDPIYNSAGWFFENKAVVGTGEYITYEANGIEHKYEKHLIIDTNGNELMTLPHGYTSKISLNGTEDISHFKNGKAIFCKREAVDSWTSYIKVLVVNENMTTSEFVIDKHLQDIRFINTPEFCGVLGCYFEAKEGAKDYSDYNDIYILYDFTGKVIWQTAINKESNGASKYIYTENDLGNIDGFISKNGYMNIVDQNGKWGLLDLRNGTVKISCQYDYLGAYSDGLIEVCSYGKWGYIDINGNVVIKPTFLYATSFVNGRAFVERAETQFAVIDKNGNTVANYSKLGFTNMMGKFSYEAVTPFTKTNGIAILSAGSSKFSLITSNGGILHTVDDSSAMMYVSNKYVFDGERMYEIVAQ